MIVSQFWIYFTLCFTVSIVNFEHVIANWVNTNGVRIAFIFAITEVGIILKALMH